MYYGWNNCVSLTGFVGYVPYQFTARNGKPMMRFELYVPRYSPFPPREGAAQEPLPPLKITIIAGESMIRLFKKRRVHTGDICCVTGHLICFNQEKNGFVYQVYYVEPTNITTFKGYKGMKSYEYDGSNAIYNELLKEIKSNGPNDNPGDNRESDRIEGDETS